MPDLAIPSENQSFHWRRWFDAHRSRTVNSAPTGPILTVSERAILADMRPATPQLLAARALLRRNDTKFLFPRRELVRTLMLMQDSFDLVRSGEALVERYETLYLDTPDRLFFHAHRRGLRPRVKVRMRHYAERGVAFLEVKTKEKSEITSKARQPRGVEHFEMTFDDERFVQSALGRIAVEPTVHVAFPRLTLVHREVNERVTFDLGLSLGSNGEQTVLPNVVVGEIKQERTDTRSPARLAFRSRHIRPNRLSKYCVAMSLLADGLPVHRFRSPLRELMRNHDA